METKAGGRCKTSFLLEYYGYTADYGRLRKFRTSRKTCWLFPDRRTTFQTLGGKFLNFPALPVCQLRSHRDLVSPTGRFCRKMLWRVFEPETVVWATVTKYERLSQINYRELWEVKEIAGLTKAGFNCRIIHKQGDGKDCQDYRSISLLCE